MLHEAFQRYAYCDAWLLVPKWWADWSLFTAPGRENAMKASGQRMRVNKGVLRAVQIVRCGISSASTVFVLAADARLGAM
jgi:hypothetical protein